MTEKEAEAEENSLRKMKTLMKTFKITNVCATPPRDKDKIHRINQSSRTPMKIKGGTGKSVKERAKKFENASGLPVQVAKGGGVRGISCSNDHCQEGEGMYKKGVRAAKTKIINSYKKKMSKMERKLDIHAEVKIKTTS